MIGPNLCHRERGEHEQAQTCVRRSLAVYEEPGDRSGEADGRYRLGQIAADLGERDEALHQLRTAPAQIVAQAAGWRARL